MTLQTINYLEQNRNIPQRGQVILGQQANDLITQFYYAGILFIASQNLWFKRMDKHQWFWQIIPAIKQAASPKKVLKQIDELAASKRKEFEHTKLSGVKYKQRYELLPLRESHFSTYINEYNVRKASKPVMYGLIGTALFLLILACINYINMSIAAINTLYFSAEDYSKILKKNDWLYK